MNIAVIGKGGREHALVKALVSKNNTIIAIPGSDGIALDAKCFQSIKTKNHKDVIKVLKQEDVELVVIGPEVELCEGLADSVRELGIKVVGPSMAAAQLEGSKLFAKEFMLEFGVSTSGYTQVKSTEDALKASGQYKAPFVLKVDGLAAGKGVFICKDLKELSLASDIIFKDQKFGANTKAFLEEFKKGDEISYLILTNGVGAEPLPLCKDHKKLLENDEGPNTGGMGVVAPIEIENELLEKINKRIINPTLRGLKERGFFYRGVLYFGIIVTDGEPYLLEYNTRLGDPETQAVMPLLDGDWSEVFSKLSEGSLVSLNWRDQFSTCITLASENYPGEQRENHTIKELPVLNSSDLVLIHCGSQKRKDGGWMASGGRVFNCVAFSEDKIKSVEKAYKLADKIKFQGKQFRKDIKFSQ